MVGVSDGPVNLFCNLMPNYHQVSSIVDTHPYLADIHMVMESFAHIWHTHTLASFVQLLADLADEKWLEWTWAHSLDRQQHIHGNLLFKEPTLVTAVT